MLGFENDSICLFFQRPLATSDLLPPWVDVANMLAHMQHTQRNISIHLQSCLCPPDELKSNIHFPFSSTCLHWHLARAAECSTNGHQLVANSVCLQFGARQVCFTPANWGPVIFRLVTWVVLRKKSKPQAEVLHTTLC